MGAVIGFAWSLALSNGGMGTRSALLLGFGFALLIGLINAIRTAWRIVEEFTPEEAIEERMMYAAVH